MSAGEHAHEHPAHGEDHDHDNGHEHTTGPLARIKEIFAPHSHDVADRFDDALESSSAGIRATKVSLIRLGIIALLEGVVVVISGSVALLADLLHNLADGSTAVALWIAFAVGRRPPDRRYNYGYGKVEDVAGIFIVLMIFLSTVGAAWQSIDRLLHPQEISDLGWVALAALISFVGQEAVARYRIFWGRKIGSAALVADGYHARTDGFASLAVLLGAGGVFLGFPQADPIVGLLISLVIAVTLKDAAVSIWYRLMDAVDPALTEAVERAAHQPGVEKVASARIRWIGHRLEAEAHITVDCDLTTLQSHAVAETVRHAICHDVQRISDVVVHVDPCDHRVADPHRTTAHHVPAAPRRPAQATASLTR